MYSRMSPVACLPVESWIPSWRNDALPVANFWSWEPVANCIPTSDSIHPNTVWSVESGCNVSKNKDGNINVGTMSKHEGPPCFLKSLLVDKLIISLYRLRIVRPIGWGPNLVVWNINREYEVVSLLFVSLLIIV